MDIFEHTLSYLTVVDGEVVCNDGSRFDRESYSRFKYGWLPPAIEYGNGLANLVGDEIIEHSSVARTYVVSAPYKFVPTASHAIARAFVDRLSHRAIRKGVEPPFLLPFHKSRPGSSAYAQSTEADRQRSLATLGLHIDESRIPGSNLVVLDDIRITGSAQKASRAFLERFEPRAVWYLHAARLDEATAIADPGLEDKLNQSLQHTLRRFVDEYVRGEFQLNTRVLRWILESDQTELKTFVAYAPVELLESILSAAIGTGVAYYNKYIDSITMVCNELECYRRPLGTDRVNA